MIRLVTTLESSQLPYPMIANTSFLMRTTSNILTQVEYAQVVLTKVCSSFKCLARTSSTAKSLLKILFPFCPIRTEVKIIPVSIKSQGRISGSFLIILFSFSFLIINIFTPSKNNDCHNKCSYRYQITDSPDKRNSVSHMICAG